MRKLLLLLSICLGLTSSLALAQDATEIPDGIVTDKVGVGITASGPVTKKVTIEPVSRRTVLKIGNAEKTNFRVNFDWLPHPGYLQVWVKSQSDAPSGTQKAASLVSLQAYPNGNVIIAGRPDWSEEDGKWTGRDRISFVYRPYGRKSGPRADADNVNPDRYVGHWQQMQIDVTPDNVTVWLEGKVARSIKFPDRNGGGPIHLAFVGNNQQVRDIKVTPYKPDALMRPVDFSDIANDAFRAPARSREIEHNGVKFQLPQDRRSILNLKNAKWIDQPRDPQSYYEEYDGGAPFLYDDRMPFLRIPKADYVAAHLLAVAQDDEAMTNNLTIRAGVYGYNGQVLREDFTASVPRQKDVETQAKEQKVAIGRDHVVHVKVPFDKVIAQDLLNEYMEMEITKELRPVRHLPDPNRFRIRPLGLPSGVKIAAITMELSPLQVRVYSNEVAHAFVEPTKPQLRVQFENITDSDQAYVIDAVATHLHGDEVKTSPIQGTVAARKTATVTVPFELSKRGYYDVLVHIRKGDGELLLTRDTSLALLPPDTRKHRDDSPFGTWDWSGGHVTVSETDVVGSMYKKLGFRYGMTRYTNEERAKWGMLPGFEPKIDPGLASVLKAAENPNRTKRALIFHENSISGGHVTRVPDLFTDREPYKLSEREEATFQKLWTIAMEGATEMRKELPDWYIKLGNGPLPTKELMYQRKFPAELFDAAGNEPGSFHRLPETQPPDYVAYNASIWMDRQLLDHYGYSEKDVRQCFEIGYPGSNPTNHSEATQADYFVRLCLHSLGWEMPFVHLGMLNDAGNSYYFSNWGSTGFANRIPDANVKPAFVALSNMTLALDGAKLVGDIDAGTPSVFLMKFKRPDGKTVLAYWTIHGRRDVTLDITGNNWVVFTDQGNEHDPKSAGKNALTITLNRSPHYLIGDGDVTGVKSLAQPVYDESPADDTKIVDPLNTLAKWQVVKDRSPELESYNFMTPRRQGNFTFKQVQAFEGKENVISVKANPIKHGKETMPMYMELEHADGGVELPGQPTEIGLWVNGNTGWGRIIYELEDASGQTWKSIGAKASSEPHVWLLDWMSPEMLAELGEPSTNDWNTNDAYQHSRFNFDGWRYLAFPAPGNYIGENHPWPGNCNWKWSGNGVVKYPLKVKKLIFELPEKVLHVKRYGPVSRQEVYFTDLSVSNRGEPMIP